MGIRDWFRRNRSVQDPDPVEEATTAPARPTTIPMRRGYEAGIDSGGLTEYSSSAGRAGGIDRRSRMQELYDSYRMCTWSWVAVNAIARTITAGGLQSDWDNDDGEGDQEQPEKPANLLAFERLLAYCNPREDIRQLLRAVVVDLLVFGDAYLEVSWIGSQPVALYNLDAVNTQPLADEHGTITGYVQITEYGQRAEFEPREVIHFSYDAPRGDVFGLSPTEAASIPITIWLFTAATLKETFRKGNPRDIHVDHPKDMSPVEINRWVNQYMIRNVGPRNIGRPITTKGGGVVKELSPNKVAEMLTTLTDMRDQILADYGVPPAEAGVIESGNLGGGTGESQKKSFKVNTCAPIGGLVLEKLNFHLGVQGFGIDGWAQKFADVDMRDSKIIEDIRDQRIRSGLYTLNRGRAEIGEPPVDGGDTAIIVDRQNLVRWRDIDAFSKAQIASALKGTALEPGEPGDEDTPLELVKTTVPPPGTPPADGGGLGPVDDVVPVEPDPDDEDEEPPTPRGTTKEGGVDIGQWHAEYRRRLTEALRIVEDAA